MDRKIKILKGRAKSFDIFIQDEKGNPKDITGHSLIRLQIQHSNGTLTKYAPLDPSVDEIQRLNLKTPDAGSYKLKFQDETTDELQWDDTFGTIQTALNALKELSGVSVALVSPGIFDITFAGNDGSRAHPLISVVDSSLEASSSPVSPEVTEQTAGQAESGIDVVEEKCGKIKVKLAAEDVALLDVRNDQDIDLYVRIGTEDLDLDPQLFRGALDVSDQC